MTDEQKLLFFQCLFAAAWTDGTLGDEERDILTTLASHVELTDAARSRVWSWFDEAPKEPAWESVDPSMQRSLVEQVFFITSSDGVVNIDEMKLLDRLRIRLGFDEAEFHRLLIDAERALATH